LCTFPGSNKIHMYKKKSRQIEIFILLTVLRMYNVKETTSRRRKKKYEKKKVET